jgi:hypothetical protein
MGEFGFRVQLLGILEIRPPWVMHIILVTWEARTGKIAA